MAPCYFTESKLFWYSWKFSFILTGTHKLLRHESAWTTLISQSMHMYIWLMAWMWWKHVKHLWSFCVWWAAGSCWSKCTSQAHRICLILVGSAGRFYQSHWLLIWCITLYLHHLSNHWPKCWNAPLHLWVCILGELEQGLCLMYLLWFCIMSYRATHMVYAVFVLVAWSWWLSGKLNWVLFRESYCDHLVKYRSTVGLLNFVLKCLKPGLRLVTRLCLFFW